MTFVAGSCPYAVAVGDFNGYGVPDLAVANFSSQNVTVLLGNGDGSFQAPVNLDGSGSSRSVATADFNGDGLLDLAVADSIPSRLSVFINNTTRQASRYSGRKQ